MDSQKSQDTLNAWMLRVKADRYWILTYRRGPNNCISLSGIGGTSCIAVSSHLVQKIDRHSYYEYLFSKYKLTSWSTPSEMQTAQDKMTPLFHSSFFITNNDYEQWNDDHLFDAVYSLGNLIYTKIC